MYLWDAEWPQYATSSRYTSRQVWSKDFRWFLLQLTIQAFLSHCLSWVGIDRINRYWYTHDALKQSTRYTHAEEEWNKVSRREAHRRLQRAVFKHVFIQPAIQLIGNWYSILWQCRGIPLEVVVDYSSVDAKAKRRLRRRRCRHCLLFTCFRLALLLYLQSLIRFSSVQLSSIRFDATQRQHLTSSLLRVFVVVRLYLLCGRSLASS